MVINKVLRYIIVYILTYTAGGAGAAVLAAAGGSFQSPVAMAERSVAAPADALALAMVHTTEGARGLARADN